MVIREHKSRELKNKYVTAIIYCFLSAFIYVDVAERRLSILSGK
jgi:hypothetical protein